MRLWYKQPAGSFSEALPIGNGSMGGMIYGGVPEDHISLNLDTLWSGTGTKEEVVPKPEDLKIAKNLIYEGKYYEAEQVIRDRLLGFYNESYMPMATLYYKYLDISDVLEYERELDLETGCCNIHFCDKNTHYDVQYFASYPDQLIVIKFRAAGSAKLNLSFRLESMLQHDIQEMEDSLILRGVAPTHVEPDYVECKNPVIYDEKHPGMAFVTQLQVLKTDGKVKTGNHYLVVENAAEAVLTIHAEDGYQGYGEALIHDHKKLLRNVTERYELLYRRHVNDYQNLFKRVDISLGEDLKLPTDQRLKRLKEGKSDPELYGVFFQYNRYLLISSSREGTQAANLQGIWNEELRPAWSSNYTININTEMNYWAACSVNLAECQKPLNDLLYEMSIQGRKTAMNQYGCRGWAANHNIDLWRHSNPVAGLPVYAYWPVGGLWMACSLAEYYRYTLDEEFRKKIALPIVEGCVEFLLDWLDEGEDGRLYSCPSTSPENTFYDEFGRVCSVSYSSTMDVALAKEIFMHYLELSSSVDERYYKQVNSAMAKLPDYQIGPDGCIQEWIHPFREVDKGHRHLTPAFGLHPGTSINEYEKPEILEAVKNLIEKRISHGGGHIGWSCAWLACLFARLRNKTAAEQYITQLLCNSVYNNMFDLHPPLGAGFEGEHEVFQIDGNFGSMEAMSNMFLQSHLNELYLLPCIPDMWKNGKVSGLRGRGGFVISLSWSNHVLESATITSQKGKNVFLRADYDFLVMEDGKIVAESTNGRAEFESQASHTYKVRVKQIGK